MQAVGSSRIMAEQGIFERFVRWNIRMCGRLSPPVEERTHPYPQFDQLIADFVAGRDGLTLVDIGAGRRCDYAARVDRGRARRGIVRRPAWPRRACCPRTQTFRDLAP